VGKRIGFRLSPPDPSVRAPFVAPVCYSIQHVLAVADKQELAGLFEGLEALSQSLDLHPIVGRLCAASSLLFGVLAVPEYEGPASRAGIADAGAVCDESYLLLCASPNSESLIDELHHCVRINRYEVHVVPHPLPHHPFPSPAPSVHLRLRCSGPAEDVQNAALGLQKVFGYLRGNGMGSLFGYPKREATRNDSVEEALVPAQGKVHHYDRHLVCCGDGPPASAGEVHGPHLGHFLFREPVAQGLYVCEVLLRTQALAALRVAA